MKGDPVPDEDHILRYVRGGFVQEGPDGLPVILGGGFIARPRDSNCTSYNWLECLRGSLDEQIQQVRDVATIRYGAKAKLVRLNVGSVVHHLQENADGHKVTVIHDPLSEEQSPPRGDPSHTLMTNVPDENDPNGELIGDLIRQCVIDVYPARAPKPESS